MFSSWVKIEKSELINFGISQEVAKNLQEESCPKKMDKVAIVEENNVNSPLEVGKGIEDFVKDEMLAKMLQIQYDKECELNKNNNGSLTACTSHENYCTSPLNYSTDSESEEDFNNWNEENWDTFESSEKEFECVSPQKTKINKQGRRTDTNKLSSKVFNSLESHSYNEEFCKYKVHRDKKKRPIYKLLGIDQYTWHLIRKMIKDQIIKKITNIVNFDNEVITIRAICNCTVPSYRRRGETSIVPVPCSIKVFKPTSMPYEKIRITASEKAKREAAIYTRLKAAGLPCLDVITLKEHVLVISSYLEPVLSEVNMMRYTSFEYIYEEVRKMMKRLYEEANLIHANLTEHNIVWYSYCHAYFINVSQAVDASHEKAFDYLFRDCTNMVNFFRRRRVPNVKDPDNLFIFITGYSYYNKEALLKLHRTMKTKTSKKTETV